MPRSLVIVESPAKAKTIGKILGNNFTVQATMGHIIDLPPRKFGIDIENGFQPEYKVLSKRKDTLRRLQEIAKESNDVYLASDPDREGEAIAFHLANALKLPLDQTKRIILHEITRDGVLKAFENPASLQMNLFFSQQTRRIIDRIVGYKISPLLWEKIAKRTSAGRVQSVALKFVVDREREIQSFKTEEYWKVTAKFEKNNKEFEAVLEKIDGKKTEIRNKTEADKIVNSLSNAQFTAASIDKKDRQEKPYPPFTTSLLQQAASSLLGFNPKRTMRAAQKLYEGIDVGDGLVGLITYMRTDSFKVSSNALNEARKFIENCFGKKYLPEKPNFYASRKGAQEAHEAIRPTSVIRTPESVRKYMDNDLYRIYKLIWERFIASQMPSAVYEVTNVEIAAKNMIFSAQGTLEKFDGFSVLLTKRKDVQLPTLMQGEELKPTAIIPSQHFTEPPPRYTEASLIKTLEKHSVGRPSTYAPTLGTIEERGYVLVQDRKLFATPLGVILTEKLERHFTNFINYEFTAHMEEKLDKIEEGQEEWSKVIKSFYNDFANELMTATKEMKSENGIEEEKCAKCDHGMLSKWTRSGKILECSNKNCGNKKIVLTIGQTKEKCAKCSSQMMLKFGKHGKFLSCTRYPDCEYTLTIIQNKILMIPENHDYRCNKCGAQFALRYSKRGPFLSCVKFPRCRNAKRIPNEWLKPLASDTDNTKIDDEIETV